MLVAQRGVALTGGVRVEESTNRKRDEEMNWRLLLNASTNEGASCSYMGSVKADGAQLSVSPRRHK
jgi:hypothetical protein